MPDASDNPSLMNARGLMAARGLRPKKRYGQNFLIDGRVLDKIITAAGADRDTLAIEIGPGLGALTQALARVAGRVAAVEIDAGLAELLEDNLRGCGNVDIIRADALEFDFEALIRAYKSDGLIRKVIAAANLPYYAATPITMRLIQKRGLIASVTVMLQKEVAGRFAAAPNTKDYGALSVMARYFARPAVVANVPRNCFFPRPDVDSAVVRFELFARPPVHVGDERAFFAFVKAAFATRRKTLANCLAVARIPGLGVIGRGEAEEHLARLGHDPRARGETLSMEEFAALYGGLEARGQR